VNVSITKTKKQPSSFKPKPEPLTAQEVLDASTPALPLKQGILQRLLDEADQDVSK
jgi:hypothetical protein